MILNRYLEKQSLRPKLIDAHPSSKLGSIIVIPAYDEASVLKPLQSLHAALPAEIRVEVIIVFNASENSPKAVVQRNINAAEEARHWFDSNEENHFCLHIIQENQQPAKHAGVGLARKIGMDEAVRRFDTIDNSDGIIVCFDADSQCEPNYLRAIAEHFANNPNTSACSIYFEHPLKGNEFSKEVYKGITYYEMHLRYYKNALAFAELPYAFHTIGSSMAVRAVDYCKQGGMNKRKAGEDFYFLQKFIKLGNFTDLNSTMVIPSPRQSHRVPFGTGRAIQEMLDNQREIDFSYAWESIIILKQSFAIADQWYEGVEEAPQYLEEFIGKEVFEEKLNEIRSQSTNRELFIKRLFHWFDAFQCLKFMHFLRDSYFPNQPLVETVPKLLQSLEVDSKSQKADDLLKELRKLDGRN